MEKVRKREGAKKRERKRKICEGRSERREIELVIESD